MVAALFYVVNEDRVLGGVVQVSSYWLGKIRESLNGD